ncbi:hypothetical protein [Paenibacillus koleovorans]|uniref:hypothetical protein n=1 Tax=Paenibacillus koleovorans TaxID=121608 RepID=UPI000FD87F28|nr:hypothetical protein [Paenibacillus koleovorans]
MSNKYNNSTHDAQPDDKQTPQTNSIGELRNGRKSVIKNSNPTGDSTQNEYLNHVEHSQNE